MTKTKYHPKTSRKTRFTLFHIFLLSLVSCVAGYCQHESIVEIDKAGWDPAEFPISYWGGPPPAFQTLERYREIKEAGMTFVMPGVLSRTLQENLQILKFSEQLGLKAFVYDARMPQSIEGNPGATETLDAIISDYKNQPALAGFLLQDEPSSWNFRGLAEVVTYMRVKAPQHLMLVNLFPNYATTQQLQSPSYEEYVREYLQTVKPFVLSYDHYHFLENGERPEFLSNLALIREEAQKSGVPFWNIVLAAQVPGYRNLTEAELRFEAMQTLVYGGKGLLWFSYWQYANWGHSLVTADGTRDPHYGMIQRINAEVRALGNELLHAESIAVFHSGVLPPGGAGRAPGTPVEVTGTGNLAVGVFRSGKKLSTLITNGNWKQSIATEIMLFGGSIPPRQLNTKTRLWEPVAITIQPGGARVSLKLPPGGAALLKW